MGEGEGKKSACVSSGNYPSQGTSSSPPPMSFSLFSLVEAYRKDFDGAVEPLNYWLIYAAVTYSHLPHSPRIQLYVFVQALGQYSDFIYSYGSFRLLPQKLFDCVAYSLQAYTTATSPRYNTVFETVLHSIEKVRNSASLHDFCNLFGYPVVNSLRPRT